VPQESEGNYTEEEEEESEEEEEDEETEINEGEAEINEGEAEEGKSKEVSSPQEQDKEKEHVKKCKSAQLQVTIGIKRNGKATGSAARQKVTPITGENETKNLKRKKEDKSATNTPTITFSKSTVRDYSQPAKKYCRDKFLLGELKL
jgi:hypothetical protein